MRRPLFWIGSSYLWVLMLLALSGEELAKGLLIGSALAFSVELALWIHHKRTRNHKQVGIVPAVLFACLLACSLFLLKLEFSVAPALEKAGPGKDVVGTVTELQTDSASGMHRCVVNWEGTKVLLSTKAYVPKLGEEVSFHSKVQELGLDQKSMQTYYRSIGVYLGAFVYDEVKVTRLEDRNLPTVTYEYYRLRNGINRFRSYLERGMNRYLSEDLSAVMNGMVLGDKTRIGEEQQGWFQKAGILHLFAVSGFHTSLWAMLVYKGLLRGGFGRKLSCLGGMAFTVFFMALTGFSRSGVRAGLMLLVFFLGHMTVMTVDALNSLGFAVLLLTIGNPFSGGNTGLLLSYFATLGIMTVGPILGKQIKGKPTVKESKLREWAKEIGNSFCISASTFVFTLPCIMLTFGSVSLISPLSNLLITTVSSMAILLGGVGALVNGVPVLSLLSRPCFLLSGLVVRYITKACELLSDWKFSYIAIDSDAMQLAVAGCLILIAVALLMHKTDPRKSGPLEVGSIPRLTTVLCLILLLGSALSYDLIRG